ncbi:hypothetical protein BDY21DRAFT_359233 [Lineolata rhizophorae]|uniref:Uncharacterized protein n=1 Tax=Lineolata rhizophorae TaxID=578093 RepID=A0A6A6NM89_9PEZI|nr:hypothetical protein BDY21DRAFT_359233 [Lineolata rhizophorae]
MEDRDVFVGLVQVHAKRVDGGVEAVDVVFANLQRRIERDSLVRELGLDMRKQVSAQIGRTAHGAVLVVRRRGLVAVGRHHLHRDMFAISLLLRGQLRRRRRIAGERCGSRGMVSRGRCGVVAGRTGCGGCLDGRLGSGRACIRITIIGRWLWLRLNSRTLL